MTTDTTKIELRPARPEDGAAIADVWYRGWCDAHLGNVPDALVALRTRESFDARVVPRIADTVVAVVGGQVAGFVTVIGDEVEQVYVAERHRGGGVATALLDEAERMVAAGGHRRAWLVVVPGNARARAFYARQGWTDEGPYDHVAPDGQEAVTVPTHRYVKPVTGHTG
ncbi:GNAT family N-acetyltransferase [Streptantibioticus cattleyicolor]|uniref:GCN5-related N-acetyltransferase n=1 Tax=Streptantibioticus cattleyicolor (strain ATCC 35852 / DSM 46488 / JCM 4925 / NBRC 14057 / NRRL 8057) TaxID=1003195 RepID=F8JLJ3_STREN|nr:GNAT family N-acetyltransferase [Streptantibioticus cattleyicolor]AEW98290.1 GCN5-related N-acetyltransferase [Streptantibioticus cattleyicolor NRRL 8057 = DSM 46488]CCB72651.1 Acetyltransferase [Streptantibioticus cattleyicolor NRRL 8057 = DSM 46488]